MTPESASAETAPPPLGEAGRITGVFLDPKKAFADIAARPGWIVPVVLLIVAYLVFMYCFTTHVGWEHSMRTAMETNTRVQQMDPQQRETVLQQQLKFAPIGAYVVGPIAIVVMALIIAGVLLLMVKMMGASLSFKQMFGITTYAMLPGLISSILAIIVVFVKNPEDFNLQNPLAFNLGAFLEPPPNSAKALYSGPYVDRSLQLLDHPSIGRRDLGSRAQIPLLESVGRGAGALGGSGPRQGWLGQSLR